MTSITKKLPTAALHALPVLLMSLNLSACGDGGSAPTANVVTPPAPICTAAATAGAQSVVYVRQTGGTQNDVYLVREDCTGLSAIANTAADEFAYGVEPTTGRIVISRDVGGQTDLFSVLPDGSDAKALATGTLPDAFEAFAPGGRVIYSTYAADGNGDLYSVNIDGSDPKPLATSAEHEGFRAVTPDGWLLFQRPNTGMYAVPVDASAAEVLLLTSGDYLGVQPDGRILYLQYTGTGRALYSMRHDATDVRALATAAGDNNFRQLSADGGVIYYEHADAGSNAYDVYSVKTDGTDVRRLTSAAADERLAGVGPDGRVYFDRWSGSQYDTYSVAADGSALVALATTSAHENHVALMPSGRVVYSHNANGSRQFYSVAADGSDARQLTFADGPSWRAATADGRVIYEFLEGGFYKVASVKEDGTGNVVLSNAISSTFGALTSNGRVILDTFGSSFKGDLHSVLPDGSDDKALTDSTDDERYRLKF